MSQLKNKYFRWLVRLVRMGRPYSMLMKKLFSIDYFYTHPMDRNRESDGLALRWRFGRENGYPDAAIASELDDFPCSVLEVMVALALRCEEMIMTDPERGDRTHVWFADMLNNLELFDMTDEFYDEDVVEQTMDICLNRRYKKDGRGGFFRVRHPRQDMRDVELWYQAMWALSQWEQEEHDESEESGLWLY